MRGKLLIGLLILALIAVPVSAIACEEEEVPPAEEEEEVVPPAEEEEEEAPLPEKIIKIGISVPLTGDLAAYGLANYHANDLAAEDINNAGGVVIDGVRYLFQVVARDDRYSPDLAVENINEFIYAEHIDYVIMMSSACANAVVDTLTNNKVILWSQVWDDSLLDLEKYPYSFRYIIPSTFRAEPAYNWIVENKDVETAVTIAPDDATGWSSAEAEEEIMSRLGVEVLDTIFYARETTDFMPFVTKILAQNPDLINASSLPPGDMAVFAKQVKAMGFTGVMYDNSPVTAKDLVPLVGAEAVEGIITANIALEPPLVSELGIGLPEREIAKYGEAYGTTWELYGYLPVLAAAMERAQSIEPDAVKQIWEDTTQEWPCPVYTDAVLTFGAPRCIELFGEAGLHQAYWPFALATIHDGEDVTLAVVYP